MDDVSHVENIPLMELLSNNILLVDNAARGQPYYSRITVYYSWKPILLTNNSILLMNNLLPANNYTTPGQLTTC